MGMGLAPSRAKGRVALGCTLVAYLVAGGWLCITVWGEGGPVDTSPEFKSLFPAACPKPSHLASALLPCEDEIS